MLYLTRAQQGLVALAAVVIAASAYLLLRPDHTKMRCVAVDVTNPSLTDIYTIDVRKAVRVAAKDGVALKVLPFAGSPKVESVPLEESFHGLTDLAARRVVHRMTSRIEAESLALQGGYGSAKLHAGSGVVDALAKVNEGKRCTGGLTALTDALERRLFDVYHADYLTVAGRGTIIDTLKDDNTLPDLAHVAVSFPYGGVVPDGSVLSEDPKRVASLKPMFQAIVVAGGGRFSWGS
jgi:hypothetical protein